MAASLITYISAICAFFVPCPRGPDSKICRTRLPRTAQTSGVTLTEIMIGIGLLLVAFLAVAGLFARNLELQGRTQEMTEASEIARRLLNEIRQDKSSLPSSTTVYTPTTPPDIGPPAFPPAPFPSVDGTFGTYELTVKVEPGSVPDTMLVEVFVSWEDGRGVALQTLFPN